MRHGMTKTNYAALGLRIHAHLIASHPDVRCLAAVLIAQRGATLSEAGPRWLACIRQEMK